ncbi:hypothetical protein BDV37DRAFT_289678 [Aspergillus pseudonomiae]|uniref:Uncharacterized protein n=1 Tax=Aspergillus pseudonomiae TaxID=1506151 RepID=A0A5N7CSL0_9EURO|nr:uncharacterized protein BDV37DRAFT_289678 [Aspergillus pseudonomiae]KAE8397134.1 hypothetical protein BDV37DRAFT_289678 [Aspergillus pseudonomiae]
MDHLTTQPSVLAGLLLATSALAAPTLKIPANGMFAEKSNKHAENNLIPVDKTNNERSVRRQENNAHPFTDNINHGSHSLKWKIKDWV